MTMRRPSDTPATVEVEVEAAGLDPDQWIGGEFIFDDWLSVTKTVTVTAQPTTVTDEPTATVTVTQAAPPLPLLEPPAPSATNYPPPPLSNVYYESCAAARADGAAPLMRGEPGYRPGLDRDGDGIACE